MNISNKNVLIIDDDPQICHVLAEYCKNTGYFKNTVIANDGSMATLKLRNQVFDVIILDVNMPKKSGVDLLKEFKVSEGNTKDSILIVSGSLDKDVIMRIRSEGVNLFLVKPFNEEAFKERVEQVFVNKSKKA